MSVLGNGNVRLKVNGFTHVVTEVFYVPELKNNLLSIGKLQEKGLSILIQNGSCKIYHLEKGLVIQTKMTTNWMFVLTAVLMPQMPTCLHTTGQELAHLWHCRYLICFIDDFTRKTWIYFKVEKSEALVIFKQYKNYVEKESSCSIKCLRTDRGGEFVSLEFNDFCKEQGIKRQLTTAYMPQQNGVVKRKNRTVMNMVRCMLSEKKVPKIFWPKAVNWTTYVLNRSPTLAVKNVTPEEAWSGSKPSVEHFRIFGCMAHVHIPNVKITKLQDKSFSCVFFGVS
uniref:Retrovirus-related Pol polyprotein from transposon TNT 1-94 n=2 Tax=Cajanus cajan TaxID=3821 RepID=A0A151T797_CAJCA|nr:Retrovirus-related Pol polyprotein from transposon TNT 1-94 [Cajanus cajan]